jgi:hypothetical protein
MSETPVRLSDLASMLMAMEADCSLTWCDTCGAWMEHDDEALARTEDYTGCWKIATGRTRDNHLCRSWRGTLIDEVRLWGKSRAPTAKGESDAQP